MNKISTYYLKTYEVEYYRDHTDLAKDGRHIGRIGENWYAKQSGGVRQPEKSPFDVLDPDGVRNEIRSAIKTVSFAASKEVGYGRVVTESGYLQKLFDIDRFVIIDSSNLLTKGFVDFWEVTKDDLSKLELGKTKKMKATKFWDTLQNQ